MKKVFLLTILFISAFKLYSQNIIFEKDINLKSLFSDKRESFPVVNVENNEIALFLLDNKVINSLVFNNRFDLLGVRQNALMMINDKKLNLFPIITFLSYS